MSITCLRAHRFAPSLFFGLRTMAESVGKRRPDSIDVDGSMLEGGGQILRISAVLSCLLRRTLTIDHIRAKRSKPGLRPQHLTGLQLVTDVCGGHLLSAYVGSSQIKLNPGHIQGGQYQADTCTAGSVALLIQVSLPCLLFAKDPSRLRLFGGTNASMAPPVDYIQHVFNPIAKRMGVNCEVDIIKRGFFPKGGGCVELGITPVKQLVAIDLVEPGRLAAIRGYAISSGVLPSKTADEIAASCSQLLRDQHSELVGDVSIDIAADHLPPGKAKATGSCVMLVAETSTGCLLAGTGLGSRDKSNEEVAAEAVDMLASNLEHQACVDEHLQDQLIILMALAKGRSRVLTGPLTLHTQTAIELCQQVLKVEFDISSVEGKPNNFIVSCEGVAFSR